MRTSLDRVLELFERAELSATEMRVLLALLGRHDATIPELADALDTHPTEITRAGRRLAMKGLIRWHHGGKPEHALLDATRAGTATIEALLTSLEEPRHRRWEFRDSSEDARRAIET